MEDHERGVEVGAGTGRFGGSLGIELVIEPAAAAARKAAARGVEVVRGVAEALPLAGGSVDLLLLVATLGFLDDVDAALAEGRRVLEPDGRLVIGFVDRERPIGRRYEGTAGAPFYQGARFHSVPEVRELLDGHGFTLGRTRQTLFGPLESIDAVQPAREGTGEGSFVALEARR